MPAYGTTSAVYPVRTTTEDEQNAVFKAVASVILLGELKLAAKGQGSQLQDCSDDLLTLVCSVWCGIV